MAGRYGKAAFDAVGPLLLIGWSEVGSGLLQAISTTRWMPGACEFERSVPIVGAKTDSAAPQARPQPEKADAVVRRGGRPAANRRSFEGLLVQARCEDSNHRAAHQKPISADIMRVRLGVGAARARRLVKIVRSEFDELASAQCRDGLRQAAVSSAINRGGRLVTDSMKRRGGVQAPTAVARPMGWSDLAERMGRHAP